MDTKGKVVTKAVYKDASRVVMSMIPMFMLLWIMYTGYKLTTETRSYVLGPELEARETRYTMMFGALTVVFGLISFIVGLRVVAELALDLSAQFQEDTKTSNIQEKKQKTNSQILVHTSVTAISIFMLIWTSHYVHKLAIEPQKERKLNHLSFLIGTITIAFGLINFLIGIAIMADCALGLSVQLQEKFGETNVQEEGKAKANLEV